MLISRRHFLRQIIVLTLGFVLEIFGWLKPKEKIELKAEGSESNFYKFELGSRKLVIKPGESFSAKIHWPTQVATKKDARMRVQMVGLLYQPLEDGEQEKAAVERIILRASDEIKTGPCTLEIAEVGWSPYFTKKLN